MAVPSVSILGRDKCLWVVPPLLTRFSSSSGIYGRRLNVWNLSCRTLTQCFDLGEDSLPLSVKFLHNPDAAEGYVSCALSGVIYRFYKCEASIPRTMLSPLCLPVAAGGRGDLPRAALPGCASVRVRGSALA